MDVQALLAKESLVDIINPIKEIVSKIDLSKLTEYKKDAKVCRVDIPNSSIKAIYGEVIVNRPIALVRRVFCENYNDIDSKSDPELLKSHISQKVYFRSEEDKKYLNEETHVLVHSVSKSPSALVANREVYLHGVTVLEGEGLTEYLMSVEKFAPLQEKSVEAKMIAGFFKLEKLGDNQTKFSSFNYLDPLGKLPAILFNAALEQRVDVILVMKRLSEAENVE